MPILKFTTNQLFAIEIHKARCILAEWCAKLPNPYEQKNT